MIDLRTKLSERIGMDNIQEILRLTGQDSKQKQVLYDLIFDEEEKLGYQAAWIFTHFSSKENEWLYNKQNELIDEVLTCKYGGKRRVILNLIYKQPLTTPLRVDFLDFCLNRMISKEELPGVQALCMKIAYELCFPIPELLQEFKSSLEMMEGNLCPAIRTTRKNILKIIEKDKNLQKRK